MNTHKVALVTGAGSGIGRAVSLALATDGYEVVLVGRREDALKATAAMGESKRLHVMVADVTDHLAVQSVFDWVESRFGRLDVLFNNAGRGAPAVPIEELPIETWLDVVNVNLNGMFFCARAAIALMKNRTPRVDELSTTAPFQRTHRVRFQSLIPPPNTLLPA